MSNALPNSIGSLNGAGGKENNGSKRSASKQFRRKMCHNKTPVKINDLTLISPLNYNFN